MSMEAMPTERKKLPPPTRKLTDQEKAFLRTWKKLENPSQTRVAKELGLTLAGAHHHHRKPEVMKAIAKYEQQESDKSQGIVATAERTLAKAGKLLSQAVGRHPCESCGNLPITIGELGMVVKVNADLLSAMEQLGKGKAIPADELAKEREQIARLLKLGAYLERRRARREAG